MVQKIAGQYLVKSLKDTLMAPPPAPRDPEEAPEPAPTYAAPVIAQETIVHDEEGNLVGRALLLANVAVYVVCQDADHAQDELRRAFADPDNTGIYFNQTENGSITGIIYVPDPSGAPRPAHSLRADDI